MEGEKFIRRREKGERNEKETEGKKILKEI